MRNAAKLSIVMGATAAWLAGAGLCNAADRDGQAFDRIERGHYLTTVADCFACHTVLNVGKPFAGGRPIETPFGVITSSNITPHTKSARRRVCGHPPLSRARRAGPPAGQGQHAAVSIQHPLGYAGLGCAI